MTGSPFQQAMAGPPPHAAFSGGAAGGGGSGGQRVPMASATMSPVVSIVFLIWCEG